MITTALKLIDTLKNDNKYTEEAAELRAEIIDSPELPIVAYSRYCERSTPSQRVDQLHHQDAIELFEKELIIGLLKRFPENAVVLAAGGCPSTAFSWQAIKRYAREHLFGVWELASGQPMPKKSMVLVDRSEVVKRLRVIEKLIISTLDDDLSTETDEALQEAFKLLVAMRQ